MERKDHGPIKMLVLGDGQHHLFAGLFDSDGCEVRFRKDTQGRTPAEGPPDVIVFAQTRRNKFPQSVLDHASANYPLAALVLLLGDWCEGETRSGHPQQGWHRVYARDWAAQFALAIGQFRDQGTTAWHAPATCSRQDQLMTGRPIPELPPLNVAVHTQTPGFGEAIDDFCEARGWTAVRAGQGSSCDVLLIECYYSVDEAIGQISSLRKRLGASPVVVICGFPRRQDREKLARALNRYALIGKPYANEDLQQSIIALAAGGRLGLGLYDDVA